MKIKDYKCKCGHDEFFFADKENQKGIYCSCCGKWLKWADKDEQNLRMKQESILEQIRAEIMQLYNEVEVVDYDHNDISRIKRAHWIIREEVLWILDKYNSHPKRGAKMKEGEE